MSKTELDEEDFELLEKSTEIWPQHKADETISGPCRNLPVFHWNDTHTFGQTLTIARNFDLYGKLTSSINNKDILQAYIDGIVSCSCLDVISTVLICIFNGLDFENPNDPHIRFTKTIPSALKSLNNLLKKVRHHL